MVLNEGVLIFSSYNCLERKNLYLQYASWDVVGVPKVS